MSVAKCMVEIYGDPVKIWLRISRLVQLPLLYDKLTLHLSMKEFSMERPYWNEDIETMQPAALHQLENEYLRTQLDYIWASSPFYQTRFAQAGVKREAIRTLADLPLLPFTEKD